MKLKKLPVFLLAVVVAFALWLYVITVVSPESEETYYNIPVVLQGEGLLEDRGLMVLMEEKPTVTLKLTGNRSDLYKMNSSNITVIANLTHIYEDGTHELTYNVSYPSGITGGAIGTVSQEPAKVEVTVDRLVKDKPIDVRVEDNGTLVPEGFKVEEVTPEYEQILITGPASVVDKIDHARLDLNLQGHTASFGEDLAVTLCDKDGKGVDSRLVEVGLKKKTMYVSVIVHQVKEIPVEVVIQAGGGATEKTSKIEISHPTLVVHGNENVMKDFEKIELCTIDLAKLEKDTVQEFELKLPTGVEVEGDVRKIQVSITFPELTTKMIMVSDLQPVNVPAGHKGQILAKELEVTVRGPKEAVERLEAEHLRLVVDFAGVKLGYSNADATLRILEPELSSAGALGTYPVTVYLEEKP